MIRFDNINFAINVNEGSLIEIYEDAKNDPWPWLLEKEKLKDEYREELGERRRIIGEMPIEQKKKLMEIAHRKNEMVWLSEIERESMLKYLHYFASGISMESIKEALS